MPSSRSACSSVIGRPRAGGGEVGEHARPWGDADAGAGEHDRAAGVVEDDVAVGQRQRQRVADADGVVQQGGDLAVRLAVAADALDRELAVLAVVGAGEAVLAGLADAVGHRDPDGDVLAGQRGLTSRSSMRLTTNVTTSSVSRIFLSTCHAPPHRLGPHAARAVEAALLVDQRVGHQPVDLVPGGGDLRGDRVAEHVDDRPHQVVVDDLVLVGADAQRRVLVRDAARAGCSGRARGVSTSAAANGATEPASACCCSPRPGCRG